MQIIKFNQENIFSGIKRFVSYIAVTICLLPLLACSSTHSSYVGQPSPYSSYYKNSLKKSFVMPEISVIQSTGQTKEFFKPFEEVREASLDILTQYQGILSMNSSNSQLSLMVMKAREYNRAPENRKRVVTYGSFFEQLLAITLTKMPDSNVTEVTVASIKPSGKLMNNEAVAQLFFSQIQIQLYNRMEWRDKFVYEKLPQPKSTPQKIISDAPPVSNSSSYKYQETEQILGRWISKSIKEEFFTINSPDVTLWLNGIVDQLKKAANIADFKTQVIIIPANGLNAFALPNGNIIVSSGLLDSLESRDQVAAVLAHELDHLIYHDTIKRLKTKQTGLATAAGLRTATAAADFAVGLLSSVTPVGPIVGVLWDLGRAGGRHLAERGAQHLETALVSNFSAETELRADTNGIKMLNKAGFDPKTNIAMLSTLQKFKDKSLEKDNEIMFNLVNTRPGIEERIKNLKLVLNELEK